MLKQAMANEQRAEMQCPLGSKHVHERVVLSRAVLGRNPCHDHAWSVDNPVVHLFAMQSFHAVQQDFTQRVVGVSDVTAVGLHVTSLC